jgi:hypothetical protein
VLRISALNLRIIVIGERRGDQDFRVRVGDRARPRLLGIPPVFVQRVGGVEAIKDLTESGSLAPPPPRFRGRCVEESVAGVSPRTPLRTLRRRVK